MFVAPRMPEEGSFRARPAFIAVGLTLLAATIIGVNLWRGPEASNATWQHWVALRMAMAVLVLAVLTGLVPHQRVLAIGGVLMWNGLGISLYLLVLGWTGVGMLLGAVALVLAMAMAFWPSSPETPLVTTPGMIAFIGGFLAFALPQFLIQNVWPRIF